MADNIQRGDDGLPIVAEKELAAMEKLFSDEKYQIRESGGFLRPARKGIVNPAFITGTLEEFVHRLHVFMASSKRIIPAGARDPFFEALRAKNAAAEDILKMALSIEIRMLNEMLNKLQRSHRNVSIAALQPFIKTLYRPLIRIYYLDSEYATSCLMEAYRLSVSRFAPSNADEVRTNTLSAAQELKYIYEKIFPVTYPLVLRMTSPIMLTQHELFYKNGSKVLSWLDVNPEEIIFPDEDDEEPPDDESEDEDIEADADDEKKEEKEEEEQIPGSVIEGLEMLERLYPRAGWKKILNFSEGKSDFAPYFARVLTLPDTFIQLNPESPLQFEMLLVIILAELFQGLRHVAFRSSSNEDSISAILDDWVMYIANVFDRTFGDDLKAYTHQVYSQADFARSNYASRLAGAMHSLIRQYFLPFYDMHLYTFQKIVVDRLPAFYPRVATLRKMLDECLMPHAEEDAEFSEATNISAIYRFDIPNTTSRHLDALCGGARSRRRTNKALIRCCSSILAVLDWWINDLDSPAYMARPTYIYRVDIGEGHIPSFSVDARTDTEEIFRKSLIKKDTAPS